MNSGSVILPTVALIAALASPAIAGPIVWVVDPLSNQIVRVDPRNGAVLGSFPTPAAPSPGNRNVGLTIANGGTMLLYQLGSPPFTDDRKLLYTLDPYTGFELFPPYEVTQSQPGPGGLSSSNEGDLLFWSHTSGDIHRIQHPRDPDRIEELFWGPDFPAFPAGGLGGDSTRRQFGLYCESPQDQCDPDELLFIGEFDPFVDSDSFLRTFSAPAVDTAGLAFDGRYLYASTASGFLFTLNANTGAVIRSVALPGPTPFDIAAVPEPTVLALLAICSVAVAARRRRKA